MSRPIWRWLAVAVAALASTNCTEDRCAQGGGNDRGFLEDTAPFTLCPNDQVLFSPTSVVFLGAKATVKTGPSGGSTSAGSASGGSAGTSTSGQPDEGGQAPVDEAGAIEVSASSTRISVIARSSTLVPRVRAKVVVFQCLAGQQEMSSPLVRLTPIEGRGCKRESDFRVACWTDTDGVAEFQVSPNGGVGTTRLCTDKGRVGATVVVQPEIPEDAKVTFSKPSTIFETQSFGLGCGTLPASAPTCSSSVRAQQIKAGLTKGNGTPLLLDGPVHVRLSLESDAGRAWLSPTPVCSDAPPVTSLVALIAPGSAQISPTYLCVEGTPSKGSIVAYLQEGGSNDGAPLVFEVRPDPVVIKIVGVAAPAIAAGATTSDAVVQLSYQYCDGSLLDDAAWTGIASTATIALTSQRLTFPNGNSDVISSKAHPETWAATWSGDNPIDVAASITGASVVGNSITGCSFLGGT